MNGPFISGIFSGNLQVPGHPLPLVFHISQDANTKNITTLMDSPTQEAKSIPCSTSVSGHSIDISVKSLDFVFKGHFKDSNRIKGIVTQSGQQYPLTISRILENDPIPALFRPQLPQNSSGYIIENVTITVPSDLSDIPVDTSSKLNLDAQFFWATSAPSESSCISTSPSDFFSTSSSSSNSNSTSVSMSDDPQVDFSKECQNLVIFATGSGCHDKDETIFGHKPFLVLAHCLAQHGISSLRYNDRGCLPSQGDSSLTTIQHEISDFYHVGKYACSLPQVSKIAYIGHSAGGITISGALQKSVPEKLAGLLYMSSPFVNADEMLYDQRKRLSKAAHLTQEEFEENEKLISIICQQSEKFDYDIKMKNEIASQVAAEIQKQKINIPNGAIGRGIQQFLSPWFKSFRQFDIPNLFLESSKICKAHSISVGAVFGSKDLQVSPELHANNFLNHFRTCPDVSLRIFPSLNHMLQPCEIGSLEEYGTIPITIDPKGLEWITSFFSHCFQK